MAAERILCLFAIGQKPAHSLFQRPVDRRAYLHVMHCNQPNAGFVWYCMALATAFVTLIQLVASSEVAIRTLLH